MRSSTFIAILCMLFISGAAIPAVNTGSVLNELSDLSGLPAFKGFRAFQFSSYDRTGGNRDSANFLGREGNAVVLADVTGPGCVTRIWSANPGGTIKVYLDGEATPRILAPFQDIFLPAPDVRTGGIEPTPLLQSGRYAPFVRPFSTTSSGGWICYLPIPFARSCRVEVEGPGKMYYHVTYRVYPEGTKVTSFTRDPDAATTGTLNTVAGALFQPHNTLGPLPCEVEPRNHPEGGLLHDLEGGRERALRRLRNEHAGERRPRLPGG